MSRLYSRILQMKLEMIYIHILSSITKTYKSCHSTHMLRRLSAQKQKNDQCEKSLQNSASKQSIAPPTWRHALNSREVEFSNSLFRAWHVFNSTQSRYYHHYIITIETCTLVKHMSDMA